MKKLLAIILIVSVTFTSCLKDTPAVDFSNVGSLMEIQFHDANGNEHGGLESFSQDGLNFSSSAPDTMYFVTNFASPTAQNQTVTVTVGVNDAARVAYNATSSVQFVPMPSNCYKLINTTATLTPGNRLDTFYVVFYPANMDPTQSYMLPCGIVSATAGGKNINISANFGNIYWHVIGNPMGGNYLVNPGGRWNYTGLVTWAGPPAPIPGTIATNYAGTIVSAGVIDPYNISLTMGNVPDPVSGSATWIITANSTYSSVSVQAEPNFYVGYSNVQAWIINYVPHTSTQKCSFEVLIHYNNTTGGAGNDRILDEVFTQQ